jgi:heat shock protein HslJ
MTNGLLRKVLNTGFAAAMLPLVFAACVHAGSTRPATTLEGEWRLNEVRSESGTWVLGADAPAFTLNLAGDGKASGQNACNRWRGVAKIENGRLQLVEVGSTRMRCNFDDAHFSDLERSFLTKLQEGVPYALDKGLLVIHVDAATWVFAPQP